VRDGADEPWYAEVIPEAPMTLPRPLRMSADEFIPWAMEQEGRFELASGEVVAMAPERAAHNLVKAEVWRALRDAVRDAGLPCQVFTDGMAVRVDEATVYEPDASVRCGAPLEDDAVEFSDPVVVVEVLSPSTRARDAGAKLADYFRLPSVRHYLILRTDTRTAIHHARDEDDAIATAILTEGTLRLDPPGIAITLEAVFAEA
jgi:Uma2 family endonuclease